MAKSSSKDDLGEQILAQLVQNPRLSEEKIARIVKKSRNTVVKRLKKLIDAGRVLPKGYHPTVPQPARRQIARYIFITYPAELPDRQKLQAILKASARKFPYVRVTSPYDYIVFVPVGARGVDTDDLVTQLIDAGAVTKTSSLTGDPPPGSPELPPAEET